MTRPQGEVTASRLFDAKLSPVHITIDPQWIYRGIAKGRIEISKDSRYGRCLFPREKETGTREFTSRPSRSGPRSPSHEPSEPVTRSSEMRSLPSLTWYR